MMFTIIHIRDEIWSSVLWTGIDRTNPCAKFYGNPFPGSAVQLRVRVGGTCSRNKPFFVRDAEPLQHGLLDLALSAL